MTTNTLDVAISLAISKGEMSIECDNMRDANNLRQRFYRRREELRRETTHELFLVADEVSFVLVGNKLMIYYSDPLNKLLEESINEQSNSEDGASPAQSPERTSNGEARSTIGSTGTSDKREPHG